MAPEHPAPVVRLLEERSALDRAYSPGHHGRWSAARRAGIVDRCLRELFALAEPPPHVALVALGGYGRAELAPSSDVDLLLLHEGVSEEAASELAERLLYPLWDAGFALGHAVRTREECLALAAERLDAATAMLDGRLLAGAQELWAGTRAALVEALAADAPGFAARLLADAEIRAERFGHVGHLLEPDLKEGAGGLRDAHALGWLAAVLGRGEADPAVLSRLGLLRSAEAAAVADARELLLRVRSALHLETGRASDRLHLEQQPQIARWMGFADEPDLPAVDALMRRIFEHARQVEHVHRSVLERFLRGGSGLVAVDPTPEGVLRALGAVARERAVLAPAALDAIQAADLPEEVAWTEGVREGFLGLLREGEPGVRMLEVLDRLDLLRRYLPEWALVRCRPQRDPYHRYPVDVHLLRTAAEAARLLRDPGEDPLAAEAAPAVSDPDGVLLGAVLHDIGKVGRGSHVAVGRELAERALSRMGFPDRTRELVAFLVAEHLLLADTAVRRDLEDEDVLLRVAARAGTLERLAALAVLTAADAAATGPAARSPWRLALVSELTAKVRHVLERGEAGPETAERLAERAAAVRDLLPQVPAAELERFLERLPPRYLLAVPPELVARHHSLLHAPLGAGEVRTFVRPGARPGTSELTAVAADRPGLLSMIAGSLALAGLSILSAQVFTTGDGVAVDLFEVQGTFEKEIPEERWREVRRTLRRALEGRLALEPGVEAKRRRYPETRRRFPLRVEAHPDASETFTVIEVGCSDRIGLLFDITRTLAEHGIDVHLAKVATYGERVVDAFYVRDALGRKLEPEQVAELERALAARLG